MSDIHELDRAAAQAADEGRWDDADRIWTTMRDRVPHNRNALWGLACSALQRGDAVKARALLLGAQRVAPLDKAVLLTLASACKLCNDVQGENAALAAVLVLEPNNLQALLGKAALLERIYHRDTPQAYDRALRAAPRSPNYWPEDLRAQLEHAEIVVNRQRQALFKTLSQSISAIGAGLPDAQHSRWQETASIMAKLTQPYYPHPDKLLIPRLAATPFLDKSMFPWIQALESRTDIMRDELMRVLKVREDGFVPYLHMKTSDPTWDELNHSKRWSVLYLWKNGVRDEENVALCPETMRALQLSDQAHVRDNAPNAMFSALAPHTHIPPHCGETNARVVVHLPLIVPENCGHLRVGFEQREWKVGEALIFDDSIEHEAFNNSDELRVVLLFDVWHPHLTAQERAMVNALVRTSANFHR